MPTRVRHEDLVDETEIRFKGFGGEAEVIPDSRQVRFVVSTGDVDRDNDTIDAGGWDISNYVKNPVVLWAHSHSDLPVGKCVKIGVENGKLVATAEFATHPFAETVYQLVKGGFMRATSVGFRALEYVRNEVRQGIDFKKQELLEFSIVPVPANQHALVAAAADGVDLEPVREWVEAISKAWPSPVQLAALGSAERTVKLGDRMVSTKLVGTSGRAELDALGAALDAVNEKASLLDRRLAALDKGGSTRKFGFDVGGLVAERVDDEPLRWNRSLSKAFDIAAQEFPAQSREQALAAAYLESPIKNLHHGYLRVRSARMGAFLVALNEFVADETVVVDDIRNLDWRGQEAPPLYEDIQLNSKRTENFLVDGLRFLQWNGTKLCVRVEPRWYGLEVTHYAIREQAGAGQAAMEKVQARAKSLNFLKGEAFTLGGEFLTRGDESTDDLILDAKNGAAIKRLMKLVDDKGAEMESRGALLVGPPGTGKTLSGRILMNHAKATFIWVSSRDFAYSGGYQGLSDLFEMARENAPCVAFIEDVDNWLDGHTCDLMKTEMDGIKQVKGVLTILTTNYPEQLPKALIDRPGRFHDVLRFDLPATEARAAMLAKWLPGLDAADYAPAVDATAGMSGAHLRELARFAGIIAEQDGLDKRAALTAALAKVQEQRDLITSVQANGSRYRAPTAIREKTAETSTGSPFARLRSAEPVLEPSSLAGLDPAQILAFVKLYNGSLLTDADAATLATIKRGRVLSAANESRLKAAMAHLVACAESANHSHATLGEVLAALPQAPPAPDDPPADEPDPDADPGGKGVALVLHEPTDVVYVLRDVAATDDEKVFDLLDGELADDDERFDVDEALLRSALKDAITGPMIEMARVATERALNQLRGRVD